MENFPESVLAIYLDMFLHLSPRPPATCHAGHSSTFCFASSGNGFPLYTFMKLLMPVNPLLGLEGIAALAPMEHGQVNWHGFHV